jgi:hypothetical protein
MMSIFGKLFFLQNETAECAQNQGKKIFRQKAEVYPDADFDF